MANQLFAKKPMSRLLNEAQESGEHTLRRSLGPISLTALGVGGRQESFPFVGFLGARHKGGVVCVPLDILEFST